MILHKGTAIKFTKEDALKIQAEHLANWRVKLNPECYADLAAFAEAENAKMTDKTSPYDVCRGSQLDNYVDNWKPSKQVPDDEPFFILNGIKFAGTFADAQASWDLDEFRLNETLFEWCLKNKDQVK